LISSIGNIHTCYTKLAEAKTGFCVPSNTRAVLQIDYYSVSDHQFNMTALSEHVILSNINSSPSAPGQTSSSEELDLTSMERSNSNLSSQTDGASESRISRYKGRPPVSEVPELLELCENLYERRNVSGLAMLARQRGLPPSLRCKIWPVLLKYHPYVQHPYIEPDFDDDDDENGEEEEEEEEQEDCDVNNGRSAVAGSGSLSLHLGNKDGDKEIEDGNENGPGISKEIDFDIRKYLRNSEKFKSANMTPELRELYHLQDKLFATIKQAIMKFINKWGSILKYSSGLTWIALGLAEWVPPLPGSEFVLCGRDDIAKNGTKLRNVNDSYFERCESYGREYSNNSSTVDNTPVIVGSPKSISSLGTASLTSESTNSSQISGDAHKDPFRPMSFSEVYERLVLVILHTPDTSERDGTLTRITSTGTATSVYNNNKHKKLNQKLEELPKFGGTIEDRVSFFFFGMRKLMPELYGYLSDEDCLKGDWILWWLKYCGSKEWSRYDRGRTWDTLLGFRINCHHFERDIPYLNSLSDNEVALLGPDLFWYLDVDDSVINNGHQKLDNKLSSDREHYVSHSRRRSSSLMTLLNQVSVGENNRIASFSSLSLEEKDDKESVRFMQLPFSVIDPHIQIIFISLAFLKSKEFTIMELDQSEIIQLFSRLSSLKTSEIRSFVSTEENIDGHKNRYVKKSNRDIENIILEAGELWRKFIYMEMVEENS